MAFACDRHHAGWSGFHRLVSPLEEDSVGESDVLQSKDNISAYRKCRRWFLPVLILSVIVVLIVLVVIAKLGKTIALPARSDDLYKIAFSIQLLSLLLPVLVTIWFIDVFTGEAQERMGQMIFYAYLFPFLSIGSLILFLGFADFSAASKVDKSNTSTAKAGTFIAGKISGKDQYSYSYPAIGIVRGCVILPKDAGTDIVPKSMQCENKSDQWIVNLGGKVMPAKDPQASGRADISPKPEAVPTPADAVSNQAAIAPIASDLQKIPLEKAALKEAVVVPDQAADADANANANANANADADAEASSTVQGGLAIPLYFIVLAVFGGAISIVRRVPEYQARFAQPEGSVDYLSPERVREALVFQIMQLFTAPLIAITAFYVVNPGSRAASASLAFLAGFSSETVLKYIRAAVEKVAPETSRDWPTVHLTPVTFDFGKQQIKVPSPERKATISNSGSATLDGAIVAPPEFICKPAGPFSIAAGGHLIIGIIFSPDTVGEKSADLKIVYNGRGSPLTLELKGEGITT
jgi:hypothetical protein